MLFKRRKKKESSTGLGWYDITIDQFQKLKKLDLKDMADQIDAAEILLGINADDMTWSEFCVELKKLEFLNTEIPKTIIRKTYELNGRTYDCMYDLRGMTVARYMDYTNLIKTGDMVKILGVFLVPEGCEYGKYDLDRVYEDIGTMNVVEAYGIYNFFWLQFRVLLKAMKDSLVKMVKDPELQDKVSAGMDYYSTLDLPYPGQD